MHVIRRHVGQQGHQGVVVVFDRGIQVGVGRFDCRRNLPQKSSSQLRLKPVMSRWSGSGQVAVGIQPRHLLGLREDIAHRDRLLGPCLEDPGPDGAEVRVLPVSPATRELSMGSWKTFHQSPCAVAALDSGVLGLDPFRGHGRRRLAIVGADLEAVVNPSGGPVATHPLVSRTATDQAGQRDPARQATPGIRRASCPQESRLLMDHFRR